MKQLTKFSSPGVAELEFEPRELGTSLLLNIRPALKFHCLNFFFQHFSFPFTYPACSHFFCVLSFLGVTVGHSVGQAKVHTVPAVP